VQRGIDKTFSRSEDIFEIDQPETRIAYAAIFVNGSKQNEQPSIDDSYQASVHVG
jgi:hypothetical protein